MNLVTLVILAGAVGSLSTSCSIGNGESSRPTERQQYSYQEQEVSFENDRDSITLVGTLTIPDSPRPAAAVILIPNSSSDRDESAGRHRPLQVLAAHLARGGLIVLRSDSRGIGHSGGSAWPDVTKSDIASDVEAAIKYLRRKTGIGSTRIGLIGHSEGEIGRAHV